MKQNNKPLTKNSFDTKEKEQNKNRVIFLTISSFIFIVAFFLLFLTRSGDIVGTIVDNVDTRASLSGVNIQIDDDKQIENNRLTSSFLLQGIKPGEHKLTFKKSGYQKYDEMINLKAGETLKLVIKLPPEVKNAISDSNIFKLSRYNLATISGSSISIIDPLDNQKPQVVANGNRPSDILTVPEFNKMYIANFGDSTILVIDLKSLKVIKEINFDKTALITKLDVSPAKDKIYVLNFGLNKISSIGTASDEINPNEIKLDKFAKSFIVDNLGRLLLFNASGVVIQTDSGSVVNSLDFKISFSYNKAIYSKQTNTLLLIPFSNKNLASYDLSSDKATEIQLKENIVSAVFNPSGDKIYVLSPSSLSIIESGSMKVLREGIPINTTGANNMVFSPDGRRLFIASGTNINIFDINNESMLSDHLGLNGTADNIIAWSN